MAKFIDNHLARQIAPVMQDPVCANKGDIVEYAWKQKVKKVGEGEDDYVVYEEVEEVSRVNRQAFIEKDADQVGVLNILEKVRRSGDMTLLNQTGALIPDGVQDYTKAPSSLGEALKAVETGGNSFTALKEIFGDTSFEALANMSTDQLESYLQSYVAAKTKKGVQVDE